MEEKEKVIKFIQGNRRDLRRRGVTVGVADEKGNIKSYHWDKDKIKSRLPIINNLYDKNLKHRNGKNRIVGVKDYDGTPFDPNAKKKSKAPKEEYKNKVYEEMVKNSKNGKRKSDKPESSLIDKEGNVELKDDNPSKKPKTKKTDNKSDKK